jgi:hypothetical protein
MPLHSTKPATLVRLTGLTVLALLFAVASCQTAKPAPVKSVTFGTLSAPMQAKLRA